MPERNRDQSVEHVLRRVLSADTPATADVCLDGETAAAWTSGALQGAEAAAAESHLADCAHCQAVVAALIRITPEPAVNVPIWRRWHLRWAVPLATAATAVAIWIATPGPRPDVPQEYGMARAVPSVSAPATEPPSPSEATPSSPPSSAELESARARPPATLRERDAVSQDEKRAAAPSRLALQDRAPAAPEAKEEVVDLQKAEPSAARAIAPSVPAVIEVTSPGEGSRWRITNGRQVEWSSPGSTLWRVANMSEPAQLNAGASPSPTVCWLAGRQGAVLLTTDGLQFNRLPFPEMADLVSVTAVDDRAATVTASDGRRWSTQDRGLNWTITR